MKGVNESSELFEDFEGIMCTRFSQMPDGARTRAARAIEVKTSQ